MWLLSFWYTGHLPGFHLENSPRGAFGDTDKLKGQRGYRSMCASMHKSREFWVGKGDMYPLAGRAVLMLFKFHSIREESQGGASGFQGGRMPPPPTTKMKPWLCSAQGYTYQGLVREGKQKRNLVYLERKPSYAENYM